MRKVRIVAACCAAWCGLFTAGSAVAGDGPDASALRELAARVPDLEFPGTATTPAEFDSPRMLMYKPEGAGPFPALVLAHQCGGLNTPHWQNASMLQWARDAVARGYVALLIDSLGPRGASSVCFGPQNNVTFAAGVKDALQAAEHLRRFDFVDKGRIALAGYSWGAMVALLASSRHWGGTLARGGRFAAAAAFYPGCFTIRPRNAPEYEIARQDIDTPLLVLMGADDTETPPADCVSRLEPAIKAGAPVQLHVYPQATHCWDCRNLDGYSKVDVRGNRVAYRYNREVTEDSARRLFEFLERAMPRPR